MPPRTNDGGPERERPASGPGPGHPAEQDDRPESRTGTGSSRPPGTGDAPAPCDTEDRDAAGEPRGTTAPRDAEALPESTREGEGAVTGQGTGEGGGSVPGQGTHEGGTTAADRSTREGGGSEAREGTRGGGSPAADDSTREACTAEGRESAREAGAAEARQGDTAESRQGDTAASRQGTREAGDVGADGADTVVGFGEVDVRVAAVRRVGAAGRRWRAVHLGACAAMLAVALTAGAVAFGAVRDGGHPVVAAAAVSPGLLSGAGLDAGVAELQAHLRAQPRDADGWASLGLAYVEQARTKGDPSRYPQAQRALKRSLELRPGNDQALSGRAALAAARHDFDGALRYADRALERNPYSERALCTRIDALVELGRYEEAARAARTADERRPGVPVFTRYAYVHELRGDVATARRVLEQALAASVTPGDIAYVATQLGNLSWSQGDHTTALAHYARALAADETYLPALEGRARAQAAAGRQAEAIEGLEDVVARFPLPGPLVALGELYEARGGRGDAAKAREQYTLVDAWTSLARANGVDADLDTALAAADHGDRAAALRAARAEWARRRTVHTADALAWALHVNGRDEEALPYARRATATGYRNAVFLHHLGMIERATGRTADARAHLTAALDLNPGFSPLGAREARAALKTLKTLKTLNPLKTPEGAR
ncbi:tetratricopeptide repeat protein [Streptomyces sp. NPDC003247]|uniref:tetratricopeptide repeat protein n=1 Tax=Streptomyces sp. NPDC003247 TaxID=3364677 RepID=UPI0036A95A67